MASNIFITFSWIGTNEFDTYTDLSLFKEKITPASVGNHVEVSWKNSFYPAHIWTISTNREGVEAAEFELGAAIDSFALSQSSNGTDLPACAACIYTQANDTNVEVSDSDEEPGPNPSVKDPVPNPSGKEPPPKKIRRGATVKKLAATVLATVENHSHFRGETVPVPPAAPLRMSQADQECFQQMLQHYKAEGTVYQAPEKPLLEKILEKLEKLEQMSSDHHLSTNKSLESISNKQAKIEKMVIGNREMLQKIADDLNPIKSELSRDIRRSIVQEYDHLGFDEIGVSEQLAITDNQKSSLQSVTPGSSGILQAAQISRLRTELTPGTSLASEAPPKIFTSLTPSRPKTENPNHSATETGQTASTSAQHQESITEPEFADLPSGYRHYNWMDLDFQYCGNASAIAKDIEWTDLSLLMQLKDNKGILYQFGMTIFYMNPKMDKTEFVKVALREVFPPAYFLDRNSNGRVPNSNFAKKKPVDKNVFNSICFLAEHFCAEDKETKAKEIPKNINQWLRQLKPKLDKIRSSNNLIEK